LAPTPAYRLEAFGGLALGGTGPSSVAHQRRRLALLALLAASGDRGVSRDRIAAYLWPETDSAAARHSLEQLVHALRRALGDEVFTGVNPVVLNGEVVGSDVHDFEQARRRDDFAAVVDLYRGPFLDGFFLDGAGEFERWVEGERTRFAGQHLEALVRLAELAEQNADHAAAVEWRKRIAASDPLSSRHALQYMRALTAVGDRGAALSHARVHEQLVRQELETEPDPSIVTYVARLRGSAESPATRVFADEERGPLSAPLPEGPTEPSTSGASASTPHTARSTPRLQRYASRLALPLGVVGLAALAVGVVARRPTPPLRDPHAIVIVPFRITSADSSAHVFAEGIGDLMAPMLPGGGAALRAVDARTVISAWKRVTAGREGTADDARRVARDLGAGQALFGTLVVTRAGMTLSASVLDPDGGERQPALRVTGLGPADSVQSLLDGFVAQLLGRNAGLSEQRLATLTSVSPAARRAYIDGRAEYRRAHDAAAIEHFARALEIDSTFALAGLNLAIGTLGLLRQGGTCGDDRCQLTGAVPGLRDGTSVTDDSRYHNALRLAWQARDKLGRRDRLLLNALFGRGQPQVSRASDVIADFRAAAAAAPDHADTQYLTGVLMLYQGAAVDYPDPLSAARVYFLNALNLDPTYLGPLARLVDLSAYARDVDGLRTYAGLYLSRDSTGPTADFIRWRVAAGTNNAAALRAIRERFDSLDLSTLRQIRTASLASGVALQDADRASALLIARASSPQERQQALFQAHMVALNRGRPQLADSLLRERRKADTLGLNSWNSTTLAALYGNGIRKTAEEIVQARTTWLAAHPLPAVPRPRASRTFVSSTVAGTYTIPAMRLQQAMWDYHNGDTASASASARWLYERDFAWLGDVMQMLLATDRKRADAAALRARVDSLARGGCCAPPVYVNLPLAHAFARAGDDSAALRALRRGRARYAMYFLATHLKEEGEAAYRLKDDTAALRAFDHYLALRSDPEPSLVAERDSVRALVERLRRGR
jgi:DNA-binding SARP family transcriptional activator